MLFILQGHSDGVWGVVTHPFEPTFISAGYDQQVFKWSLVTHKVIWRAQIEVRIGLAGDVQLKACFNDNKRVM